MHFPSICAASVQIPRQNVQQNPLSQPNLSQVGVLRNAFALRRGERRYTSNFWFPFFRFGFIRIWQAEFELLLREEQQDSSGEADCRNSTFSEALKLFFFWDRGFSFRSRMAPCAWIVSGSKEGMLRKERTARFNVTCCKHAPFMFWVRALRPRTT